MSPGLGNLPAKGRIKETMFEFFPNTLPREEPEEIKTEQIIVDCFQALPDPGK